MGEPMYVAVRPPQYLGGGPAVFAKNTFLDIQESDGPAPLDLRRVKTEPASRAVESSQDAEVFHDCLEGETDRATAGLSTLLYGWIEGCDPSGLEASEAESLAWPCPPPGLAPDLERWESPGLVPPGLGHVMAPLAPPELERWESPPPGALEFTRYETYDGFEPPQVLSLSEALPLGTAAGRAAAVTPGELPHTSAISPAAVAIAHLGTLDSIRQIWQPPPPPAKPAPTAADFLLTDAQGLPNSIPAPVPSTAVVPSSPSGSCGTVEQHPGEALRPNTLSRVVCPSGSTCITWVADARKLESWDKQAVSPQFSIDVPGHGEHLFKIVIYPTVVNDGKHGAAFKKAKGRGRVVLKCDSELPEIFPNLTFRIGVGSGNTLQATRGPVSHNFKEQSCGGLLKGDEEWHFNTAVDASRTFIITIGVFQ